MDSILSGQRVIAVVSRYGTAMLLTAAALLGTLAVGSMVESIPTPLFLAAIGLSAWKNGFGPGVVTTALSGFLIDYFFIEPTYEFMATAQDTSRLIIFGFEGTVLSWLIAGRTAYVEELQMKSAEVAAMANKQQSMIEDERKLIAREIHDELGQELSGLKIQLHILKNGLKRGQISPVHIENTFDEAMVSVDQTISTVRRIATDLRPAVLDDLGLLPAIEWQLQEFTRRTGISAELETAEQRLEMNELQAITVFRIVQESLTNVMRHAGARKVTAEVDKTDSHLSLTVADDGKGISDGTVNSSESLGLLGMRERAMLIGGTVEVGSREGGGTLVRLEIPLTEVR